jgi:hypothetical protein
VFVKRIHWEDIRRRSGAPPACVPELDVVEFARKKPGFEPDEKQAKVLRSISKRWILNCSRQWGKTTELAAGVAHRMFTEPGILILVASPSLRQTHEFMVRLKAMVMRLGIPMRGDGENKTRSCFRMGPEWWGCRI